MVDTDDTKFVVFEGSYGNWTPIFVWDCGSGAPETPTVLGVFHVGIKGYSFGEQWGYSCYYYTQFYGNYLIHTGLYYANTWIPMDTSMNIRNSHGCVRLDPPNAKWIWDNVSAGTTVVTME
jgi:lipoprotein-anchoring transpeptidase ErfK/SrfK